jgi:hypothetical protein
VELEQQQAAVNVVYVGGREVKRRRIKLGVIGVFLIT